MQSHLLSNFGLAPQMAKRRLRAESRRRGRGGAGLLGQPMDRGLVDINAGR